MDPSGWAVRETILIGKQEVAEEDIALWQRLLSGYPLAGEATVEPLVTLAIDM